MKRMVVLCAAVVLGGVAAFGQGKIVLTGSTINGKVTNIVDVQESFSITITPDKGWEVVKGSGEVDGPVKPDAEDVLDALFLIPTGASKRINDVKVRCKFRKKDEAGEEGVEREADGTVSDVKISQLNGRINLTQGEQTTYIEAKEAFDKAKSNSLLGRRAKKKAMAEARKAVIKALKDMHYDIGIFVSGNSAPPPAGVRRTVVKVSIPILDSRKNYIGKGGAKPKGTLSFPTKKLKMVEWEIRFTKNNVSGLWLANIVDYSIWYLASERKGRKAVP